jgi:UDP-glucose 4-epimerase
VLSDETGVFNVAGPGVVMLSQALRRMGRPPLPLPALVLGSGGQSLLRLLGAQLPPNLVPYLSYGRGLDTTKLASTFGWSPERSTADTLDEFILSLPPSSITSDRLEAAQQRLQGVDREVPARAGGGHG